MCCVPQQQKWSPPGHHAVQSGLSLRSGRVCSDQALKRLQGFSGYLNSSKSWQTSSPVSSLRRQAPSAHMSWAGRLAVLPDSHVMHGKCNSGAPYALLPYIPDHSDSEWPAPRRLVRVAMTILDAGLKLKSLEIGGCVVQRTPQSQDRACLPALCARRSQGA